MNHATSFSNQEKDADMSTSPSDVDSSSDVALSSRDSRSCAVGNRESQGAPVTIYYLITYLLFTSKILNLNIFSVKFTMSFWTS